MSRESSVVRVEDCSIIQTEILMSMFQICLSRYIFLIFTMGNICKLLRRET